MTDFTLETLNSIISSRAGESAERSYTASLLSSGTQKCARKFGEEAVETIIAAMAGDKAEMTNEVADVLYHLLVLLKSEEIELSDVMQVLETRTSQSGLEEKASR